MKTTIQLEQEIDRLKLENYILREAVIEATNWIHIDELAHRCPKHPFIRILRHFQDIIGVYL